MTHTETATTAIYCDTECLPQHTPACVARWNAETDRLMAEQTPADLTAHRVQLADGTTGIVIGAFGHPGDQALDINTDDGRMLDDVDSRDVTDLGRGSY